MQRIKIEIQRAANQFRGPCKEWIRNCVEEASGIPLLRSFQSKQEYVGSHDNISAAFFKEAAWFIDISYISYLTGYALALKGNTTWSVICIYYSNFYSANALLRFRFNSITRIKGQGIFEVSFKPNDFPTFKIRKCGPSQSHDYLWNFYYKLWKGIMGLNNLYNPIISPPASEYHFERNFRSRINYSPGEGFGEFKSIKKSNKWSPIGSPVIYQFNPTANELLKLEAYSVGRLRMALLIESEAIKNISSRSSFNLVIRQKIAERFSGGDSKLKKKFSELLFVEPQEILSS